MNPLDQVAANLALTAPEYRETEGLLNTARHLAAEAGFQLDDQAELGLAVHLASLLRRLAKGERVNGIDASMFGQVPVSYQQLASRLLEPLYAGRQEATDLTEVGLVALHFAAAQERMN